MTAQRPKDDSEQAAQLVLRTTSLELSARDPVCDAVHSRNRMELLIPDVFALIVSRLSDLALVRLYRSSKSLKSAIDKVLRARASKLVKLELVPCPNADWMVIYHNLVQAEQLFIDTEESRKKPESSRRWSGDVGHAWIDFKPWKYGLMDLNSMLVLVETYGPVPTDSIDSDATMTYVVIAYLLEQGVLQIWDYSSWPRKSLKYAIEHDLQDDVVAMVALPTLSIVEEGMELAASLDRLDILQELVRRYPDIRPGRLLDEAAVSNDPDVVNFVLSLGSDEEKVNSAVAISLYRHRARSLDTLLDHTSMSVHYAFAMIKDAPSPGGLVLRVLVDRGLALEAGKWRALLNRV